MTEQKHDDASGASRSDAGLGDYNPLTPAFEAMRKDAERWRWLAGECDGEAQDVFTTWLARTHEPKEGIDAKIDEAMKVPNV